MLVTAVALLLAVGATAVGPVGGVPAVRSAVAASEAELQRATAARREAEQRLVRLQESRDELVAEVERLGALDADLTEEIATARRELREFAVSAYIDGGRSAVFRSTLSIEQAQALSWQSSLAAGGSSAANAAAERYLALKKDNSPRQIEAAGELDRAEEAVEAARFDAIQAAAHERDAEAALAAAREEQRRAAARRAEAEEQRAERAAQEARRSASTTAPAADPAPTSSSAPASSSTAPPPTPPPPPAPAPPPPPPPPPAPGPTGNPTAAESATLARIRSCESGGNYSIVSASGRYRGAYQFDRLTWQSVGGSGDPAAASPSEQDHRALLLLRMRGTRPWPHCGR